MRLIPRGLSGTVLSLAVALCSLSATMDVQCRQDTTQLLSLYPQGTKNVLILQSYHKQFSWTDSIVEGIDKVLNESRFRIIAYTEYMDTKRFPGPERLGELQDYYRTKYRDIRFDVILCADDNAYRLLLDHQSELFPGTPVVFCGVNDFHPGDLSAHPNFTGVAEIVDAKPTLDTALRLHPAVRNVTVLVDRTETGVATRNDLLRVLPDYENRVRFTFLGDLPMEDILSRVSRLRDDSILVLLNYNLDGKGHFFDHRETIALLSAACPVPIYGFWDFQLGSGIVGGKLITGRAQGEIAARLALGILDGAEPSGLPVVVNGTDRFLFDFNQLKRFAIPVEKLPPGSEVINAPPSFYEINKLLIWVLVGFLVVLLLTLVGLALHIVQRRKSEQVQRRMNRSLMILSTCNQRLILARDETSLLIDICRVVVEIGGYRRCRVGYARDGGAGLRLMGFWPAGPQPDDAQAGQGGHDGEAMDLEVLRTGKPRVVRTPEPSQPGHGREGDSREASPGSFLVVPLDGKAEVFGVLRIESAARDAFDADETALLATLADNLAYGITALRHTEERRAALAELRASQAQLTFLLESLPIVPFTAGSADLRDVTYVGSGVTGMTGYPGQAFQADPAFWSGRVHPDDLPGALAAFEALGPGRIVQHRYRFRVADGAFRWLSDTRRVGVSVEDSPRALTGVWQDVTEDQILREEAEYRRRQVVQADKLASLGEVVAGVAHEINNPNAFISYNIPLLEETWNVFRPMVREVSDRTPDWSRNGSSLEEYCLDMDEIIRDIAVGASRIASVVQNLKEFSRYNTPSEPVPFSLNDAVDKALLIVGSQVRKVFRTVSLELAENLPDIRGHALEMEQVVANLLVNATQAVQDGPGVLRVRTEHAKDLGCVLLEVEDNGRGMSREVLEHVFEPFFTTRRESGGTGLGLSVSYRLVREHDGVFCVLSRPGVGTRFAVLLPTIGNPSPAPRPTIVCVEQGRALSRRLSADLAQASWAMHPVRTVDQLEGAFAAHPEAAMAVVDAALADAETLARWRQRHPLALLVVVGPEPAVPLAVDHATVSLSGLASLEDLFQRIVQVIL